MTAYGAGRPQERGEEPPTGLRSNEPATEPRAGDEAGARFFGGLGLAIGIGAVVGVGSVAYMVLLAYVYRLVTPETAESAAGSASFATGTALDLFFVVACGAGGFLAGSRGTSGGAAWPGMFGIVVGGAAAVSEQAVVAQVGGILPAGLALYGASGVLGGGVGGWIGGREATLRVAGERAAFRGTLEVARSRDADGVAAAIGSVFGGDRVAGVGVWRSSPLASDAGEEAPPGWIVPATGTWSRGGEFAAKEMLRALSGLGLVDGSSMRMRVLTPLESEGRRV